MPLSVMIPANLIMLRPVVMQVDPLIDVMRLRIEVTPMTWLVLWVRTVGSVVWAVRKIVARPTVRTWLYRLGGKDLIWVARRTLVPPISMLTWLRCVSMLRISDLIVLGCDRLVLLRLVGTLLAVSLVWTVVTVLGLLKLPRIMW